MINLIFLGNKKKIIFNPLQTNALKKHCPTKKYFAKKQ